MKQTTRVKEADKQSQKTEKAAKKADRRARRRQRLRIQNEPRFYFILQLIFAAAQILLAYTLFLADSLSSSGVIIFALFGAVMMLLAGKAWQNRTVRRLGRALSGAVLLLFLVVLLVDVLTTRVTDTHGLEYVSRTVTDYLGQTAAYCCVLVQPLVLVLFPTFAIAARRVGAKSDIRILQIGSWALPALSALTLALTYEDGVKRLSFRTDLFGISCRTLLVIYLVCTAASVLAVFMSYPYGIRPLKRRMAARQDAAADAAGDRPS